MNERNGYRTRPQQIASQVYFLFLRKEIREVEDEAEELGLLKHVHERGEGRVVVAGAASEREAPVGGGVGRRTRGGARTGEVEAEPAECGAEEWADGVEGVATGEGQAGVEQAGGGIRVGVECGGDHVEEDVDPVKEVWRGLDREEATPIVDWDAAWDWQRVLSEGEPVGGETGDGQGDLLDLSAEKADAD